MMNRMFGRLSCSAACSRGPPPSAAARAIPSASRVMASRLAQGSGQGPAEPLISALLQEFGHPFDHVWVLVPDVGGLPRIVREVVELVLPFLGPRAGLRRARGGPGGDQLPRPLPDGEHAFGIM